MLNLFIRVVGTREVWGSDGYLYTVEIKRPRLPKVLFSRACPGTDNYISADWDFGCISICLWGLLLEIV